MTARERGSATAEESAEGCQRGSPYPTWRSHSDQGERHCDRHPDSYCHTILVAWLNRHCLAALMACASNPCCVSSERVTVTSPPVPPARTTADNTTIP